MVEPKLGPKQILLVEALRQDYKFSEQYAEALDFFQPMAEMLESNPSEYFKEEV